MGSEVMFSTQYSLSSNLALPGISSEETYQHCGVSMLVDSGRITNRQQRINSVILRHKEHAIELLSNSALGLCVMIEN